MVQKQMVDVSDNLVFSQFFTVGGLVMSPACLLGGTWVWYMAAAFLLLVAVLSAIQWWRLSQRKKELRRRGVKEPDFGKPPELEGVERLLRD